MKRLFLALIALLCLLAAAPLPSAAADEATVPTYRVGYISVPGFPHERCRRPLPRFRL